MKAYEIIAQAKLAIVTIMARVTHALAKVDPSDRTACMRQVRDAATHARELATRLEIAELELAASERTDAAA